MEPHHENASPKTVIKKIKAIKRRGVETIFQKIGVSDPTIDHEYDDLKRRFDKMMNELKELASVMTSFLEKMRDFYGVSADLADVSYEYYFGRLRMDWPGSVATPSLSLSVPIRGLALQSSVNKWKQASNRSHDVIRRSVAKVWLDRGLTPLKVFMATTIPEIQREADLRDDYVKDFDSYRRRFHILEEKQSKLTALEQQRGTTSVSIQKSMADVKKNIDLIQTKLLAAEDRYNRQNARVKEDITKAKIQRDETLEAAVMCMIICQMELLKDSRDAMSQVFQEETEVETSGFSAVALSLQNDIQALINKGGPDVKSPELHGLEKMMQAVLPHRQTKASSSGDESPRKNTTPLTMIDRAADGPLVKVSALENPSTVSPSKSWSKADPSASSLRGGGGGIGGSIFSGIFSRVAGTTHDDLQSKVDKISGAGDVTPVSHHEDSTAPKELQESSTTTNKPHQAAASVALARALYDNEPEDESELGFQIGDVLEVLAKDDSGWWEARLNGKVGSIPSNYVELIQS